MLNNITIQKTFPICLTQPANVLTLVVAVPKPSNVKCSDAVSILRDAVKAYTAFYYLGKIQNGDTILLFNAESVSPFFFVIDRFTCSSSVRCRFVVVKRADS